MDATQLRERNVGFATGAVFSEVDGEVMFTFSADPSSQIGPRKATERDKENHPDAWIAYEAGIRSLAAHERRQGPSVGVNIYLEEPETPPAQEQRELTAGEQAARDEGFTQIQRKVGRPKKHVPA